MTDDEGNILWQNDFSPFGEETGESGFVERDGFYTGKKIDRDTGLYYFGARWYDPELGRFITSDPIKDGVNWYSYVSNRPLTMIDPTGLYGMSADDYNSMSDDLKDSYRGYRDDIHNSNNNSGNYNNSSGTWSVYENPTVGSITSNYVGGAKDAVVNTVKGIIQTLKDPYQTNSAIITAIMHPDDTAWAIRNAIAEEVQTFKLGDADTQARIAGNITAEVVMAILAEKGAEKLLGFTKATKTTTALDDLIALGDDSNTRYINFKHMASEQQVQELLSGQGIPIAGAGTDKFLRAADGLSDVYGGKASDWAKISSSSYRAIDGTNVQTHAYQNLVEDLLVEMKTKLK